MTSSGKLGRLGSLSSICQRIFFKFGSPYTPVSLFVNIQWKMLENKLSLVVAVGVVGQAMGFGCAGYVWGLLS